ncbi:gamma-glutamyltransferase [Proteus myxofaciens]|uniref:Glutathione hydrolase proenzyme n=1 Tax=Proteus myxofaciens ATCC 19692 TaxID=1354337 RepID=A0A198GCJ6_9GAMM|nr:gamma-glutamyltransferase [Proteus myxofaciens]OAT35162.1 gamma-glutamyltranspeptidase [Proteus myxofaciens ATCC 19692]
MKLNSVFSFPVMFSLCFISYTSNVYAINTYEQGQYCQTASECINPITPNAMVTSPNYLATQAGINILKQGGNAVDAAIAVASTLTVVYPQMNSIGGDNFWLIYNAKDQTVVGINGSGRSGQQATIDFYRQKGLDKIPARGYLSINTVPGAISGWDEAYRYATKNMGNSLPWSSLLDSAINYAQDGFPVSYSLAYWSQINLDPNDKEFRDLARFKSFSEVFLKPNKQPYHVGEIIKQPALANSLKLIASNGANVFYQGELAHKIVDDIQQNGGLLTLDDFANHKAQWMTPIHVNYRDYIAYNLPPNTQGIASLEILNILNNIDIKSLGEGSADYYHTMIEATKEAFIDRDQYLTDPAFNDIPIEFLLSAQHGKDQAKRIDITKAKQDRTLLDPKGDTVWFGIVDKDGNAVSMIQSIYHDFGSGIVAKDTGILLQNRGSFFSLDPKQINKLEPNKLTFHTLNPAMLLKDNKPYLVYGTMGGEGQPQTQAALVTRIVDFGLLPQDAVNAPRWLYGRTWGASSNDIKIESRVGESIIEVLRKKGHPIKVEKPYTEIMGHAGAILIDNENHVLYGASDPRSDGEAAGY